MLDGQALLVRPVTGRVPDNEWPCPWCGYRAPVTHLRTAHLKSCPQRPQEPKP